MVQQIIQQLLEHQGFLSSLALCRLLQQPLSMVEDQLQALDRQYPRLLTLKYNRQDKGLPVIYVKIAEDGEDIARRLLKGGY